MRQDRGYFQNDYQAERTSVLIWLICSIVAGFLLQNILGRWFDQGARIEQYLALSIASLRDGHVWTLLTHSFLHDPDNLLHILANLLGIFFFGREVLAHTGPKRFLWLYAAMVLGGGLAWGATHWVQGGLFMGASAAVAGLLILFACLHPDRPITLLLFFILPVTIKPRYVALAALLIDLCGFLFYEILRVHSPFGFAHSAHLGGMAVGWLYYRFTAGDGWQFPSLRRVHVEPPKWMRKKSAMPEAPACRVNVAPVSKDELRAEVDRILDKINSKGFQSLSADEKRTLDEARNLLNRS